jgi:hypothetical protein
MIEEAKIFQLAYRVGIRIDAFDCPVVDKKQMLVDLVREVEKEITVLQSVPVKPLRKKTK